MKLPLMPTRSRSVHVIALALMAGAIACGGDGAPPAQLPAGDQWHPFTGSWTASGTRHTLHLGGEHDAAVIDVSGSMLLAGPGKPGRGFRADAIGFADDAEGFVGRAVWTDEQGDQVFSSLTGERVGTRSHLTGTFTGGTGRYAGATGEYQFEWQYLIEAEEGLVQGRAVGLTGRVRIGEPAP
ncbi:MAG: hypothetical protein OEW17_00670 [Gemmatimonadota bacterium]|nr:hypothetical protein [Gemmatimonadota bacterium]MDH5283454.1 hypothetical protein [Gemmatimonadota bacterium]